MRYYKLTYPIEETTKESWARFRRICDLTAKTTGYGLDQAFIDTNLHLNWKRLAKYWGDLTHFLGTVDFMYEAIYHCCFNKFSDNVQGSSSLTLVLLIEDELTRCGIAFSEWRKLDIFEATYWKVRSDWYKDMDRRHKDFSCYREYIDRRLERRIFLKNIHPDNWLTYLSGDAEIYLDSWRGIWAYTQEYESTLQYLIPEAVDWYEEWSNADVVAEHIKQAYCVDFRNDFRSINALFEAVKARKKLDTCACGLYRMHDASAALLERLWGNQYQEKLQGCLLSIYKRYQKSNKNPRGHYRQSLVTQNWIYRQVQEWSYDGHTELIEGMKKALLDIALGI